MSAILPSRMITEPVTIWSSRMIRALERMVSWVMSKRLSALGVAERQPGTDGKRRAARLFDKHGKAGDGKRTADMRGKGFAQDSGNRGLALGRDLVGQRHVEAELL